MGDKNNTEILNDRLRKKLQIRTFSDLEIRWKRVASPDKKENKNMGLCD